MLNRVLPLHQTENITIAVIIAKYLNEFIFYSSVAPLKLMIQNFFPMIKEHRLHLIFDAVWNFMEKIVWMNSV